VIKISNFSIPFLLLLVSAFLILEAFTLKRDNQSGEVLYKEYCASCHGENGGGSGNLAYLLYPKPRDFTSGKYKIKSSPPGLPPTDDDIIKTIKQGMPGTAMPAFNFLHNDEIIKLTDEVKKFSSMNNQNVKPLIIPTETQTTDEIIKLGKNIYNEVGCNMCHGNTGKGDGPSSQKLVDSKGFPIVPKNFTSGNYIGGNTKQDLYLRFLTGIDGTPMPSYSNLAEVLGKPKKDENKLTWALVHYVKSLEVEQYDRITKPIENNKIISTKTKNVIDPEEFIYGSTNLWDNAEIYSIPVSKLWQSESTNYQTISVRTMYNSKYIAIKMEWEDQTKDEVLYRVQDFQDAAAIQFSIDGVKGFHGMGSEDHPTDIWLWKAEWQLRTNNKTESDIALAYANRVSDSEIETYPKLMNDMAYLSGRDAGNINSTANKTSPVENVIAKGPQTVMSFPNSEQNVVGNGIWNGQKWQVVFVRKLKSKSKQKVKITKHNPIPIAFAIWNGIKEDRNGQKLVSTWYELELKN